MGAGQAASSALDRINYTLDWSNPLAATLDEIIKGVLKQCGADDWFDWVTGDSELLEETAQEWRSAARDLRGVVEDLVAERKAVRHAWQGDAAEGFDKTMTDFEQALLGEADDMDTVAELLEMAAAACAMAEQAMSELLVEIVEALMVTAATTAILSLLTAGAAAAIGPMAGAANVAYRAAKATRIAAKLADKLADIAKRTQALAKLSGSAAICAGWTARRSRSGRAHGGGSPATCCTATGRRVRMSPSSSPGSRARRSPRVSSGSTPVAP